MRMPLSFKSRKYLIVSFCDLKGAEDEVPMMPLSRMPYDINLNRSNSDCTTRQTDASPFVRMSAERTSMRRKKVWQKSVL